MLNVFPLKLITENKERYFRHLFPRRKNAAKTAKKITAVCGNGAIAVSTVCQWFARLSNRNFELEVRERYGKPAVDENDQIEIMI